MPEKVLAAFCCEYVSLDFSDILLCIQSEGEFLCCTGGCCCAKDAPQYGVGMIEADKMRLINGDGQICALGLPCCFLGCKKPATLCRGGEQCLCIKAQAQCPCGADAIPACMCAVCFLQCAPTVGICQEPAVPLEFKK